MEAMASHSHGPMIVDEMTVLGCSLSFHFLSTGVGSSSTTS